MNGKDSPYVLDRFGSNNKTDRNCRSDNQMRPRYATNMRSQVLMSHGCKTNSRDISNNTSADILRNPQENLNGISEKVLSKRRFSSNDTPKAVLGRNRYHANDESRFSELKPGIVSESLREAMGLGANQLPLYIYRMRILGYPPGHLESISRLRSDIMLFTNDGCEVTAGGEVLEQGEFNEEKNEVMYDFDKLIDFPGFNVDLPTGIVDECKKLNFPSMQEKHRKEAMIKQLSISKAGLDKKPEDSNKSQVCSSKSNSNESNSGQHCMETEMLLSEEQENQWLLEMGLNPADGWYVVDALELDENQSTKVGNNSDKESFSHQVERSHVAFSQNQSSPVKCEKSEDLIRSGDCLAETTSPLPVDTLTEDRLILNNSCEEVIHFPSSPRSGIPCYGESIVVSPGTPIVFDQIDWSKLPDSSCFSTGMADPLPYENLPNATGSFQKLRKILREARSKVGSPYKRM